MNDLRINLDAVNPVHTDVATKQVEDRLVVFVPFNDHEMRINQTVTKLKKGVPTKVTRDQARILLEASIGYTKD